MIHEWILSTLICKSRIWSRFQVCDTVIMRVADWVVLTWQCQFAFIRNWWLGEAHADDMLTIQSWRVAHGPASNCVIFPTRMLGEREALGRDVHLLCVWCILTTSSWPTRPSYFKYNLLRWRSGTLHFWVQKNALYMLDGFSNNLELSFN